MSLAKSRYKMPSPGAYITGLAIDEQLQRMTASGTSVSSIVTDALGSTILVTDQSGATTASFMYDAYGNTTQTGTTDISQQYAGRENDATGLYFYRARYYSPALQRFVSEDPKGWTSGQTNEYSYVAGNPVNSTDPTGLDAAAYVGWSLTSPVIDYGETTLVCKGKQCGAKPRKYKYRKVCIGPATPGASVMIGAVKNFNCNDPGSYEGGFWEVSGGAVAGGGCDMGTTAGPDGKTIWECSGGLTTPGVSFLWCYYVLVSSS